MLNICKLIFFLIFAFCFFGIEDISAMSSSNYRINWDSINIGGLDSATSANYQLLDTVGDVGTGVGTSANYDLRAGYRQGIIDVPLLSFSFESQSNASKTAYTAFNNATKKVTVTSVAAFLVSDYIAVVENEGGSQLVTVGKITDITDLVVTVDKWSGNNATMSAVPAGGDDYVYKMDGGSGALGDLSVSEIKTAVSFVEVTTNAVNGYTSKISEDGDLRYGSATVDDVADGTVTIGSEEYGVSTVGDDAAGAGDFAITSSTTVMQSSTFATESRTAVIFQAAISNVTASGNYSHQVVYTVTPNF